MRRWRIAAALLLALLPSPAPAQRPAATNLGFESWSPGDKPEGWFAPEGGYAVSSDCGESREGRCSLKIEGGKGGEFQPVTQVIFPGTALGHRLTLSGLIRTEDVRDGWAGLWLRADSAYRANLVLENMQSNGPRGTTPWTRFEISIPVAANASQVAFGVLLAGRGTAWFDALELEVDASVNVPAVAEPALPPRPVASQSLAGDEALALPEDERPAVSAAWQAEARRRARPIRSLFSDDFSDLGFLAPILSGKRVVALGESAHGVAEFNWMKVRLVKFLHERLGFDVIAFESSLGACEIADRRIGTQPPAEVMRDCLFPVWHTSEVRGLFEYLERQKRAGTPLTLAGFDVQTSGRAGVDMRDRLVRFARLVDDGLADTILGEEKRLRMGISAADAAHMQGSYRTLADKLAQARAKLVGGGVDPRALDLEIQEARSRVRFVEELAETPGRVSDVRDEGMADNLDFLLDRRFPGKKVVVWAHNFHVSREPRAGEATPTLGSILARRRGAEVYTIALYMGRGAAAWNTGITYAIEPPPRDSLEAILANGGYRMSFFDLGSGDAASASWTRERLASREWGKYTLPVVPARAYDGLIYIDTVTPPEYAR